MVCFRPLRFQKKRSIRLQHPGIRQQMNSANFCLDTHPLVWYFTGQKTLSRKAKQIIDEVFAGKNQCFISVIVLLELFHLSLKVRKFSFPQLFKTLQLFNIVIVPLDKVVLSSCFALPKDLDIHDRIIASTSKVNDCILITKDKTLLNVQFLKTVW